MMRKKIGNLYYCFDHIDGRDIFSVQSPRNVPVPAQLYKYYALSNTSVDALTNHYLFASSPEMLNDRFDSSNRLIDLSLPDNIQDCNAFLKRHGLRTIRDTWENRILLHENVKGCLAKDIFAKWGIVSMASENDDILMWSHYAKDSGYCVCFDTKHFDGNGQGPFPIHYGKLRPSLINEDEVPLIPIIQMCQKHTKWKYEKEYRYLVDLTHVNGRQYEYPIRAIVGIYLGTRFFEKNWVMKKGEIQVGDWRVKFKGTKVDLLKKRIIDFALENRVPVYLDWTTELCKIDFMPIEIRKQDDNSLIVNVKI